MSDDTELLRAYAKDGSEAAFRQLVERHIPLVQATAQRIVAGDIHLAQDVTQTVFTDLARKAASLPTGVVLGGWLHRHTCFTAAKAVRTEQRRRARERTAMEINTINDNTGHDARWAQLAPVLDDALNSLATDDRDAIVLRYFERRDLRSIGATLGISDDTAQKRISRALEKLRDILLRRGVTLASATMLGSVLDAGVVTAPVSASLAASVSASAISSVTTATHLTFLTSILLATSSTKTAIVIALVILATGITFSITQNQTSPTRISPTAIMSAAKVEAPKSPDAPARDASSQTELSNANTLFTPSTTPSLPVVGEFLKEIDQLVNSPPSNLGKAQIMGLLYSDIRVLAHYEPALALSKVGLIDDPKTRNTLTGEIYGAWLATQTPQGLAALAQLPAGTQTQAYYLQAFQTWAGMNPDFPPSAAAAAVGLPPGPNQKQALSGVAASWATYDPQADLNWASSITSVDTAALYSAVVAVSAKDPSLAAQYVGKLTGASEQSKAIQNISVNMTKTDPTATLAWLDKVATGETYDNSVAKLISTVVVKNPTLASALMNQVTKSGVSDAVSVSLASSNWGRTFPHDAAAWLQTLPASPTRDAAIQKLVPSTSGN